MKKIFIIFLTIIILLYSFTEVIAEEEEKIDVIGNIKEQLDEIECNLDRNNQDETKIHLAELRKYVYIFISELMKQNLYTSRAIDIIIFASKAIEENNIEHIIKARSILDEIIFNKPTLTYESWHS